MWWSVIMLFFRLRGAGIAVAVFVVSAGAWAADRRGLLPDAGPILVGVIAAVGALTILLGMTWATPPDNARGVRSAVTIRNSSLAAAGVLAAGTAMFALGVGKATTGVLLPGLALVGEFLVMAVLASRAIWYGRRPTERDRLLAERAAQAQWARAEALARAERSRAARQQPEPPVHLVEVDPEPEEATADDSPSESPQEAPPAPALAAAAHPDDELDLIDLTGGDDDWFDDDPIPVTGGRDHA